MKIIKETLVGCTVSSIFEYIKDNHETIIGTICYICINEPHIALATLLISLGVAGFIWWYKIKTTKKAQP